MICPVSLGKELCNNPHSANIIPVNVHLPVVFAVYSQLRSYGIELRNNRDHYSKNIDKFKQINPILQWLRNSEIQTQASELENFENLLATVEENMKLLSQELQQVSLYFSGNEVTADV